MPNRVRGPGTPTTPVGLGPLFRRLSRLAFLVMWVPFVGLMVGAIQMGEGSYGWAELSPLVQVSVVATFSLAVAASTFLVLAGVLGGASNRRVSSNGLEATATILTSAETGHSINESPVLAFTLLVQPSNAAPFEAYAEQVVSRLHLHRVDPGQTLRVRFDPETLAVALLDLS